MMAMGVVGGNANHGGRKREIRRMEEEKRQNGEVVVAAARVMGVLRGFN